MTSELKIDLTGKAMFVMDGVTVIFPKGKIRSSWKKLQVKMKEYLKDKNVR
jgi:hypothetical protein